MKIRCLALAMFALFIVAGPWLAVTAQQPVTPIEINADQDEEEPRYQFMAHGVTLNGQYQEIYLKLDCWTGKTWRFHASSSRWTPITEPKGGYALDASPQFRYELFAHDYYDTSGEEQELILRTDSMSGFTWSYRGVSGAWKDIPQDE